MSTEVLLIFLKMNIIIFTIIIPPYIFNNLDKYKKWIYNEKLNGIIEY